MPGARTSGLAGHHVGGRFCGERLGVYVSRPLFQHRHEGTHDVLVIVRGHALVGVVINVPVLQLVLDDKTHGTSCKCGSTTVLCHGQTSKMLVVAIGSMGILPHGICASENVNVQRNRMHSTSSDVHRERYRCCGVPLSLYFPPHRDERPLYHELRSIYRSLSWRKNLRRSEYSPWESGHLCS
jgi:hypothetical protein